MRTLSLKKGFSLAELIVVILISSVVIFGCAQVLHEGMQLFRVNQAAASAQMELTRVSALMSAELMNSSAKAVFASLAASPYKGVRFVSPISSDGVVQYDADSGKLSWQRYIAYYFVPEPSGGDGGILYRVEKAIAGGDDDIEGVASTLAGISLADFATSSSPLFLRKPLSKNLTGFDIKKYDAGTTFGGGAVADQDAYDFTVEAGDKSRQIHNSYYLELNFKVVPKAK